MTPRSLFIIILRVLGIVSLKELFTAVPQLIYTAYSYFSGFSVSAGLFMVFVSLLTVVLFLWISYVLIFKSPLIVNKLGLDQGFSEDAFQLNISISSILRIVLLITGALIVLSGIPEFCRILYNLLSRQEYYLRNTEPIDWSPLVFSGVKIILGLLIIGERKRILEFLLRPSDSEKEHEA